MTRRPHPTTAPTTLVFVAPWECSRATSQVPRQPDDGVVICFVESVEKGAALPWHRQKLVLVLSAMRHFADALLDAGYRVDYRRAASYEEGIVAAAREHDATRVIASEGREWEMVQALSRAQVQLAGTGIALERREDRGFMATREEFTRWAAGRRGLRMEFFYREMRRRHGILMEADGTPTGGSWNFDAENRLPWPAKAPVPQRMVFTPDAVTRGIMARVSRWRGRWASADGFALPVTRTDARALLQRFVHERLPTFGRTRMPCNTATVTCCTPRCPRPSTSGCCTRVRWCRRRSRRSATASSRWRVPRGSSGRCSAGASTCAACTGT
ncbi:MAG: cryptochrome/photolyase family protein [Gemmatimonadaceae bacterium]|nr:cryptochrome/photolyase family protein [Gemmatimonadaceae bacterium]